MHIIYSSLCGISIKSFRSYGDGYGFGYIGDGELFESDQEVKMFCFGDGSFYNEEEHHCTEYIELIEAHAPNFY